MQVLLRDVRYGLRQLAKSRAFTLAAPLTLALGIGIAAGIALAVAASSVMRAFLYGFHGYDVFTVFAVAAILAVCGLAASYLPARRAAGVDPMVALRSE